jgi:hypothetical protein
LTYLKPVAEQYYAVYEKITKGYSAPCSVCNLRPPKYTTRLLHTPQHCAIHGCSYSLLHCSLSLSLSQYVSKPISKFVSVFTSFFPILRAKFFFLVNLLFWMLAIHFFPQMINSSFHITRPEHRPNMNPTA